MLPRHRRGSAVQRRFVGLLLLLAFWCAGCGLFRRIRSIARRPRSNRPRPAVSPPVSQNPAGAVRPLGGHAHGGGLRRRHSPVGGPGPRRRPGGARQPHRVRWTRRSRRVSIALPGPATALTGDGHGTAYLAARGGYFVVDLSAGHAAQVTVADAQQVDFTAIARRADGKLVLGSADGAVYTLASPATGRRVGTATVEQPEQDLCTRRFPCHTRKYDGGPGPGPDLGDDDRRRRSCRAGAAGRRGRDHPGRRSAGPGPGRRHPRRRNCWCTASTR